jgi:hypothetical protein
MTEAEWLASVDPQALLNYYAPRASQRKLRLAAVACARVIWSQMTDRWSREGVEIAERYADRLADRHDFAVARESAQEAVNWAEERAEGKPLHAARAALATTLEDSKEAALAVPRHVALVAGPEAGAALCGMLRDVFGNPFRPVSLQLYWFGRDGQHKLHARSIYDQKLFGELPRLADDLAAEQCRDANLLDHCRGAGPHVRGCWVLDLLTGRT